MARADRPTPDRPDGRRTVVMLHGSLSSGGMWTGLRHALQADYDVLTPDLTGYGAVPAWTGDRPFRLADEVALVETAVTGLSEPFDIVAHSYGGLVALRYAWANRARVRGLMLFEPTVFTVLKEPGIGSPEAWAEIEAIARLVRRGVETGEPATAMRRFVDYWNGQGAWAGLTDERRARFAAQAATVARNFEVGETDDMPLADLRGLDIPAFVVAGAWSTNAALTTAWTVASQLPRVESVTVGGAGHMMPVTHPADTQRLVAGWLSERRPPVRAAA